eukprot:1594999-Pleurochrysis_carterae.AAC.1
MRVRGKNGLNYEKLARHCQERFNQNPNMTVEQLHAVGVEIYGRTFFVTNARMLLARLRGGRGLTDQRKLELIQALTSAAGNHGLHVAVMWATAAELRAVLLQQVKQAAVKVSNTKAREAGQEYGAPRFHQEDARSCDSSLRFTSAPITSPFILEI